MKSYWLFLIILAFTITLILTNLHYKLALESERQETLLWKNQALVHCK
jgi:hypothetical protein